MFRDVAELSEFVLCSGRIQLISMWKGEAEETSHQLKFVVKTRCKLNSGVIVKYLPFPKVDRNKRVWEDPHGTTRTNHITCIKTYLGSNQGNITICPSRTWSYQMDGREQRPMEIYGHQYLLIQT